MIMKRKLAAMVIAALSSVAMTAAAVPAESSAGALAGSLAEASMESSVGGLTESAAESLAETALVEGSYQIGISQFAEHGSLDDCRNGFIDGLAKEGFVEGENTTYDLQNANADTGTAATIADSFVSQTYDLICAIATPSAMSAYNSTMKTDIPVIFTAVSDPVAAQLADEDGNPTGNITGTSDALPVEQQLQMIRAFLPEAKTIGILHTSSETNSDSTIAIYRELAPNYDFEIVDTAISQLSDVPMAAADLAAKVDCITNLTDNTVVQALSAELDAANKAGIPVFGSEIDQVRAGCLACEGLDYYQLGVQTGQIAARVLKGESAADIPFETITSPAPYVNSAVAESLGIAIPKEYTGEGTTTFDSIDESTQEG